MKSQLLFLLLLVISCAHKSENPNTTPAEKQAGQSPYAIFDGTYRTSDGTAFYVKSKDAALDISTDSINLYDYSDSWADERVQKCNQKSLQLIQATIDNDKEKLKALFGDSPMDMDQYVEQYLSMHKDVLLASPKSIKYEIANTFYVDEISNHGHEPDGWRWTSYCWVYWEDGSRKIIRYNWQPKTYFIDEWGLDKPLPFKQKMTFSPRDPFRSRINVYDPTSGTTKLLRNIDKADRGSAIPARFVSYNTEINQTVSVRFRILENGAQYMEIGAIEEDLLVRADKMN